MWVVYCIKFICFLQLLKIHFQEVLLLELRCDRGGVKITEHTAGDNI